MNKTDTIILILLFMFISFLFFSHPLYTGLTTIDDCGVTIFSCQDYTDETECNADICGFSCYHDGTSCQEYTPTCSAHQTEPECVVDICEWIEETCVEYGSQVTDPEPADTSTLEDNIAKLTSLQTNPDKLEILNALNLDITTTLASLNTILTQIQATEADTTLSQVEKDIIIQEQLAMQDTALTNMPKVLSIEAKITNLPATPLEDIKQEMLTQNVKSDIDEIYYLQDQLEARTDISKFSMLSFSDQTFSGTLIKKSITAPFSQGYILEIIPFITSDQEIDVSVPYDSLTLDPFTISIPLTTPSMIYSYIIAQDITQDIEQLQTGVIPFEAAVEPTIRTQCGDGICTEYLEDQATCPEDCARKFPWTIIITIIVLITLTVLIINFYKKGKLSFIKNIFRKKPKGLFRSETDKQNLTKYIKHSLDENIEEEKIKTVLLAKGWEKEQVQEIFDELQKPEKETEYKESVMEKEEPKEPEEEPSDEGLEI